MEIAEPVLEAALASGRVDTSVFEDFSGQDDDDRDEPDYSERPALFWSDEDAPQNIEHSRAKKASSKKKAKRKQAARSKKINRQKKKGH